MHSHFEAEFSPLSLTILATYKCSAQCRECCFESSPHLVQRLSLQQIITRIDKAHAAFPRLQLVCFSGGECFLLGDDLVAAIAHATSLGISTRCVTNGYWAVSSDRAIAKVEKLRSAGLTEINFSTGDEHQEFVPFDAVLNGAFAASRSGIPSLIVNEGSQQARFRHKDMVEHPRVLAFKQDHPEAAPIRLIENIWMSFHNDHDVSQVDAVYAASPGCINVLDNFVATPDGQMASCCGLTLEHIPELKLGNGDDEDFATLHRSQLDDFLKVWISVDGPKKILEFAASKDSGLRIARDGHICESCVRLYQNPRVREILSEHYMERVADVMSRFYIKRLLYRTPAPTSLVTGSDPVEMYA